MHVKTRDMKTYRMVDGWLDFTVNIGRVASRKLQGCGEDL
jgi:hypothetical protein